MSFVRGVPHDAFDALRRNGGIAWHDEPPVSGAPADMAIAVNRLVELEGGFVVAEGGKVLAELALPVAGLMSLMSFEEVREALIPLRAAAKSLGVVLQEPFLQVAFLPLPVVARLSSGLPAPPTAPVTVMVPAVLMVSDRGVVGD